MDTKAQLNVLNDILNKKITALKEVLDITENESAIIGESSAVPLMKEMYMEKQKRIDVIVSLDELFKDIYNKIKYSLNEPNAPHKELIIQLQNKIRSVTDLYVSIKVLEERNAQASQKNSSRRIKKLQTMSSVSATNAYKKNTNSIK